MLIEELATYLAAQSVTDVYKGERPTDPDACVVLIPMRGGEGEHDFGAATLKRENARAMIIVRGAPNDAQEPATRANQVFQIIGGLPVPGLLSNVQYYEYSLTTPGWLQKDANKRHEFVFTIEANKDVSWRTVGDGPERVRDHR